MRQRPLLRGKGLFTALLGISFCALANAQDDIVDAQATGQAPLGATPANTRAIPNSGWRADFTFYLWFPSTHGTIGANGFNVDFRASPSDLLSLTRFGVMGAVDVQHDRFVLFTDLMWVRLEADKQPFPRLPQFTAQVKANQVLLNPEVGYRFLNHEKIRIDALWGARYWHLDSGLRFTPSLIGANFSGSRD